MIFEDSFATGFTGTSVDALTFSSSRSEYQKIVLETRFNFPEGETSCSGQYVLRRSKIRSPFRVFLFWFYN